MSPMPPTVPDLGMLVFDGPETRHFLQGQLTCDTNRLATGTWTWGGYLTPQGRLLAAGAVVAIADETIGLVCDRGLIAEALAKFNMYRLRAKTRPHEDAGRWTGRLADPAAPAANAVTGEAATAVLGFGDGMALARVEADGAADVPGDWWAAAAERGQPWLTAALQGKLTAHMPSLDLAGGVDLDKGCYVGQEIVVRAHHRGKIKKRLYTVRGAGAVPAAGTGITAAVHGGQEVGNIIYATATAAGFSGTAAVRKDATAGTLALVGGGEVQATPPPYGLIDARFESD